MMTNKEAIEFGNFWLEMNKDSKNSKTYKFFQMAIRALEQETFINKPCVSKGACHEDKIKVLDKIKAETEMLPATLITVYRPNSTVERDVVELGSVLRILDKYKAESEDIQ